MKKVKKALLMFVSLALLALGTNAYAGKTNWNTDKNLQGTITTYGYVKNRNGSTELTSVEISVSSSVIINNNNIALTITNTSNPNNSVIYSCSSQDNSTGASDDPDGDSKVNTKEYLGGTSSTNDPDGDGKINTREF
ncbi:MAG: hypothetical protein F9K48_10630 [Candidatus Brocadia sp.]|nr:MAG: hypothetical protein F9K48_10630 [Candidatus Brocadia sp.]